MSDSFVVGSTTCSFDALIEGRSRKTESEVSVRHIPASDTDYVDLGGRKSTTIKLSLLLDSDVLGDLEGLVGSQGTLTCLEGALTAVLQDVDGGEWWPTGHQRVSASFLVIP